MRCLNEVKVGLHIASVRRTTSSHRFGIAVLSLMIVLSGGLLTTANGQIVFEKKPVRVSAQGELSAYWEVLEAGFREDFMGTLGYLNLKNISEGLLPDAILYGEYFDAEGRLCFSLVFSLNKNPQKNEPVAPGESRMIDSSTFGLFPALEPEEVKLYLVQLMLPNQPNPLRRWDVTLRVPVTVRGGGDSGLQLDPEMAPRGEALIDLMLARVTVNKSGHVKDVDVLQASTNQIESWFRDFVERQATLFPATERDVPQESYALILVRMASQEKLVPPRMSPWVKSYVQAAKDSVVPPVTTLVFMRPPTRVKPLGTSTDFTERPPSSPGLFELRLGDSRWSEPPVHWVVDPTMPHHLRREVGSSKYE